MATLCILFSLAEKKLYSFWNIVHPVDAKVNVEAIFSVVYVQREKKKKKKFIRVGK